MVKKLDGNYTRMLRAILNRSWRHNPTKQQLYGHQQLITKTIKIRRTRHAGHCWRSRDELISDVLLWTPSHGRVKAGHPARTYIQLHYADTECSPEDLPKAMDDRGVWRVRVRNIRADSATWWWWWEYLDASLRAEETWCPADSSERPPDNAGGKNSQSEIILLENRKRCETFSWQMPILVDTQGTVNISLKKKKRQEEWEIRRRIETIQTTAGLKSTRNFENLSKLSFTRTSPKKNLELLYKQNKTKQKKSRKKFA